MQRLKEFSSWAVNLGYSDIPDDVAEITRLQVMNTIAALLGGRRTESPGQPVTETSGPCRSFTGPGRDAPGAYFEYATDSMRHDFDDYLFMAHSCHSAVLAPFAVGQDVDASGRDFLRAVVIANELEGRLGASTVLGPHNGQMWSFIHASGAAAATASLMGASVEEMYHAILFSLYAPACPNLAGFMGGDSKNLTASVPGSDGIRMAHRALAGDRGFEGIFEHEKGFLNNYCYLPLPEMVDGFGDAWVTRTTSFKPIPGCAYLQAPLQAYQELREEHGFTGDAVDSIDVSGSLVTLLMESHSRPFWDEGPLTPVNVTFSVGLGLGLLMHAGEYGVTRLDKKYLRNHSDAIREASTAVRLTHDWNRTVRVMEGLNRGIDLKSLFREKGFTTVYGAVRKMRKHHDGLSTMGELFNLLTSGQISRVLGILNSPLGWETFDFGAAQFDEFRFNFGCQVTVTLKSGESLSRDLDGHRGRAEGDPGKQKPIVENKLREQAEGLFESDGRAGDLVGTARDLPESDVNQLAEDLFGTEPEVTA